MLLNWENKGAYWRLMRVDKPIGIYLLLWPTVWGLLWAAEGLPPLHICLIFVMGVVLMRSAGCVINDYADRKVDGAVERTQARPIVSGEVEPKEALQLFYLLVASAFVLVLFLNTKTIILSIGALFLASLYPFMKRYTYFPQVILGAAFGWSIPMAFMATLGELPAWLWLIYIANLTWTVAYDTAYAMVDREDDIAIGVKSTAILFGRFDVTIIVLLNIATLVLLAYVGWLTNLHSLFYLGLAAAAVMFAYQFTLIKTRQRDACFAAFLHNHWVGLSIAIGLAFGVLL
ncbi:4-hydroxybenzoate octaprenyltransferase [Brumicola nitratireducens]|uniref:4-hydroxybenzoate octaprenyltransferase n=1 Tax=Glaciecola nitratireducens (strain JCM 12485 / KCTC 12276 / FR1064) TaxID=1085623 RepID=G4QEW1_GLANF|nr:4-hydroxybenzoate octaprenyltransferase [Glaciecola nitratireducens]AEP28224.1 4-hydroxybenzoate octaprenyltransferase [Glaciecola nitratireducens FR1064]